VPSFNTSLSPEIDICGRCTSFSPVACRSARLRSAFSQRVGSQRFISSVTPWNAIVVAPAAVHTELPYA